MHKKMFVVIIADLSLMIISDMSRSTLDVTVVHR